MGGFLSVKKESELLETPKVAKDLVQVHNIAAQNNSKATAISNANHAAATAAAAAAAKAALDLARKSLQLGAKRKSIEAIADGVDATNGNPDKNPPDPIVTISKVSGISGFTGDLTISYFKYKILKIISIFHNHLIYIKIMTLRCQHQQRISSTTTP